MPSLILAVTALLLISGGCATHPPRHTRNLCDIFRERPEWYDDAAAAGERWGIPIPVIMAIIDRESGFRADAKPPRTTCLFIFPGPRPSSAYGYPQALDATWNEYQSQAGSRFADRDDFGDAVDFVGWYCRLSRIRCGISNSDAYHLYIAYHEGHAGYNRGSWRKKPGLKRIAGSVRRRSLQYRQQLSSCEGEFKRRSGCCLWPF
ncbi:hypothetical protein B2D07_10230 [Desulfococcus multivorans]|jgi:hypothetical protein|uniref:Lytic transglycosylase catalytic n=2 Tax=Desulfococcaceae TaxID=2931039 RepID=S7U0J2_DESML|nr:hypothetical protein B2D07_10230 [Desulfococcus multivorans]EPR42946.1 Lytic transglycosylase catalytic [Desulfococcus multivorans DSM 2059]SJZ51036.1 hypothetical protein SAMN02745446_00746 [Desulfococcus multivorans DSM 2059]